MMLFTPPTVVSAFARSVASMQAGTLPSRDIWGEHKDAFSVAQSGRCGYCDNHIKGNEFGDVDHYRPKGRLDEINDPKWDEKCERNEPPDVREVFATGYDWLRYDWNNYVYSCELCNRRFKRCLFPVENGTRTLPLDAATFGTENPLLLWCYGSVDPAEHLEFTPIGNIAAKNNSVHGLETIATCGLSRAVLRTARIEKCEHAFAIVKRIQAAVLNDDPRALADCLDECRRDGADERPFAGVYRIVIRQELDVTWEELLALEV